MGYLDPDNFLGGEVALNRDLAHQAVSDTAGAVNLSVEEMAAGIMRISEAKIAGAVRVISIERGHHPKDFALLAFGGGGAFVATSVARELGIPRVVIPPAPATFSALGMMMVDVTHDLSQTCVMDLDQFEVESINAIFAELGGRGHAALEKIRLTRRAGASFPWPNCATRDRNTRSTWYFPQRNSGRETRKRLKHYSTPHMKNSTVTPCRTLSRL